MHRQLLDKSMMVGNLDKENCRMASCNVHHRKEPAAQFHGFGLWNS
jgi:hypothetical protein